MWVVYILKCADGKFYTGCTSDLEDRMKRHHAGEVPATRDRLPLTLVTYVVFSEKQKAYDFEKYLKTGSGHSVMNKRLVQLYRKPLQVIREAVFACVSFYWEDQPDLVCIKYGLNGNNHYDDPYDVFIKSITPLFTNFLTTPRNSKRVGTYLRHQLFIVDDHCP